MKKIFLYWIPPILWMVFIFSLSSRQSIEISEEFFINFVIFKTLHMLEYAFLYFLFFRAFYTYSYKNKKYAFIFAIAATLIFAVSDEFHQSFIPSRQGSLRDIGIDSIGIGLSFMYTKNNIEKLHIYL